MRIVWILPALALVAMPGTALSQNGPAPAAGPPPLPQPAPVPPPLPQAEATTFYIERNGQPFGPLTIEQLSEEIKSGRGKPETMVWKSGTPNWVQAKDLAELKPVLAQMPPPVPPETRWKQYVVGTWQMVINNVLGQGMTDTITVQYRADGTLGGVIVRKFGDQSAQQPLAGTWTVQALGEDTFTMTITAPGQPPQTSSLRRIDDNTVANEAQGYQAHRIGT